MGMPVRGLFRMAPWHTSCPFCGVTQSTRDLSMEPRCGGCQNRSNHLCHFNTTEAKPSVLRSAVTAHPDMVSLDQRLSSPGQEPPRSRQNVSFHILKPFRQAFPLSKWDRTFQSHSSLSRSLVSLYWHRDLLTEQVREHEPGDVLAQDSQEGKDSTH